MNVRLLILTFVLLAVSPSHGQVKSAVQKGSLYSDSVLKLLIRASQLAADRQRIFLRRSTLEAKEVSGIRRSSTMTPTGQRHLDRLSTFAEEKMRSLEEFSEFRVDEIAQMQAEFRPRASRRSDGRLAEMADKNSTMAPQRILQLLMSSDDPEWVRRVKKGAVAAPEFSSLLQRLSLLSPARKSEIERLSLDK
jgi:hypothetical protein